jgi:hypothetical protein
MSINTLLSASTTKGNAGSSSHQAENIIIHQSPAIRKKR